MSSSSSQGVIQRGKLLVYIAENGHSFGLDVDEYTLVETVQRDLESVTGIQLNDQLLLCLDMKLEPQRSLSYYRLPSSDREVFVFNKARMKSSSSPPAREQIEAIDIPDPPPPTSSRNPHPLDDAPDPAMKALPSYERQFRYHFQYGHAIYNRTLAKMDICERLFRQVKVQERALDIAGRNLDHYYKMILQNYKDFEKFNSLQNRRHTHLLTNFGRDIEKLRSCKLMPLLQTANRKCLLDFVKEENLQKIADDCSNSHRQFENKVSEFKQEIGELKRNAEHLFSSKASVLIGELEAMIEDHQRYINEQKCVMQTLSKDVNTVKKLVDDCLTSQLSSSLRPHDAVSALGPIYENHEKSCLPKMQTCDNAISHLLDFCRNKKNETNIFVHNYMQKIAYIQYMIKDVRFKFSVFQEALKSQSDQFEHLRVVRGIGPAYRACLAEVVRRKETMKIYSGMAGQLAERLASKRETEVRRREEFMKEISLFIPRDILGSMGLFDTPTQCDVNMTPFDTDLIDISLADVDRYAPEHFLGLSFKHDKPRASKSSPSAPSDSSHSGEVEEPATDFPEKPDDEELFEGSELVEIAGTSKLEVENAKLKAELASKIALMCSISADFDYEVLDESKVESFLKTAAEKTTEALHLKSEYEKHLKHMLKMKHMQCESYEKRIVELEQRLSDQYQLVSKLPTDENAAVKSDDNKEIAGIEETRQSLASSETMDEVSCASSTTNAKSGILSDQGKELEGLDDSMVDSSVLVTNQLDSSMIDPQRDEGQQHLDKEGKFLLPVNDGIGHATSMAVSMTKPSIALPSEGASGLSLDSQERLEIQQLQSKLDEKSKILYDAEEKVKSLTEEVATLKRDLENNRKLLNESQMNCAHLENCLHEAREEAQTHLCAADRRASEYNALRTSAVKMRSLFERLRACVSSGGIASFTESLQSLAQSLTYPTSESEDNGTAEFRECIRVLADRVSKLSRGYSKAEASSEQLKKELEEKKELINTLYKKHQLEKQANKERISFGRLEVHELAAFVLNSAGHYEAVNRSISRYFLSAESVALFTDHLPNRPTYIIGQIVHIERKAARQAPSSSGDHNCDQVDALTSDSGANRVKLNKGSTLNPYGLPLGCEYFVVTVAMLPDTSIHSPPPS